MFELTINGQVYQFRFGMGFLKEINRRVTVPVDSFGGAAKNAGLRWMVANVIDGDLEALEEALFVANRGENPRITPAALEAWLEDEDTDLDQLFSDVLDFFKRANCTRKVTEDVLAAVEQARRQEQAQRQEMSRS